MKQEITLIVLVVALLSAIFLVTESQKAEPPYYVASVNSDVYHEPGCFYSDRILPGNKIVFHSEDEARAAGYRRSKVC
jgi:methylphosphotriester-DNA--protein-cysteine methyltransferase